MTRYVISDIHGGLQTFLALIRKITPRGNDRVYLLGDYIDRGSDSKGVLETIISMQEAGCDIRPLRGNHEDMLIRNLTGAHDVYSRNWSKNWGQQTLASFKVQSPNELPQRYRNFLVDLPYYLEDQGFMFVHAGLDLSLANPGRDTPPEMFVWGNVHIPEHGPTDKRRVVCGHRIRSLKAVTQSLSQQVLELDNGAFINHRPDNGNLVALNLDTMQIVLQPWLDGEAVW